MAAPFDLNDDTVVVVIGTGAGGGVLANELAQKGVSVVALEAGGRYLPDDYVNDEWESFGQLAWVDPRTTSGDWRVAKDFSGLPAWIVKAVGGAPRNPSGMKVSDIEAYKAKKRPPVCLPYRAWLVCGIGPPSSGGITTLQILGMVQNFDLAALGPDSLEAVHLIAEAGALAFADRDAYIADPDFVAVPAAALLDPEYLRLRATGITPGTAWGRRQPGMPGKSAWLPMAIGKTHEGFSTTHLSVIDG